MRKDSACELLVIRRKQVFHIYFLSEFLGQSEQGGCLNAGESYEQIPQSLYVVFAAEKRRNYFVFHLIYHEKR